MTNKASKFLPYGRQTITAEDIDAVVKVLQSDWLTQGPSVNAFEKALAEYVGAAHAVACSSGTAALHLAMLALGIRPGDSIVTSANTFLATANAGRYVGADVQFADIDPATGNLSIDSVERLVHEDVEHRIKAILPVHFAGQPCDIACIHSLAKKHGAFLVDDACHALGSAYRVQGGTVKVGSGKHSDMTVFSFHPVKHVAMGEGGAITTNDPALAVRLQRLRSHGMQKTEFQDNNMALGSDGSVNPWYYEMKELGYNYRITDIQAALGLSQLRKISDSIKRRAAIAAKYGSLIEEEFGSDEVVSLRNVPGVENAYHLYVVKIEFEKRGISRATLMNRLRENGIGTQVHYIPVPLQPYYRNLYHYGGADFPGAMNYYERALSLPMYPSMTEDNVLRVVKQLELMLRQDFHEFAVKG
jgi:UDP-4-amino-4,6-dideoxy-N-acetyl-beta-L-altrosamine transaminase